MAERSVRTIEDIARLAGVSKSTVSRALSNSDLISDKTKQRILAIAREHNFQIHQPARRLSMKQSSTLAFVTHGRCAEYSVEDLFQLEMLGAITKTLTELNYDLLMVNVDPYDTRWANEYLNTGRVDGFILMTSTRKQNHIRHLTEIKAPFIAWGIPNPRQKYCTVSGDNLSGGRLATEHLIQTGRKQIAFMGGPDYEMEVQLRYKGYEESLQAAGLPVRPELVVHGDFNSASGGEMVDRLLQSHPGLDGIVASSDLMATGAIKRLLETGRRVPEDVGVTGYDNLSIAQHVSPALTSVSQHIQEAGRLLVVNLIQYLRTGIITNVSIPVELVVRASTVKE